MQSKVRWRFRKVLWPSQNIWTLMTNFVLEKEPRLTKLSFTKAPHNVHQAWFYDMFLIVFVGIYQCHIVFTPTQMHKNLSIKFVYSEKATKFCEIFTLLLTTVHTDKSKVKISQNVVVFFEYMNFNVTAMNNVDGKESTKNSIICST